jgi:hypothetical protein
MTTREKFFECVLALDHNEYRFHVRAWTPEEAQEHLCASLRENGVQETGVLTVLDGRGVELRRITYSFEEASAA